MLSLVAFEEGHLAVLGPVYSLFFLVSQIRAAMMVACGWRNGVVLLGRKLLIKQVIEIYFLE